MPVFTAQQHEQRTLLGAPGIATRSNDATRSLDCKFELTVLSDCPLPGADVLRGEEGGNPLELEKTE